MKKIFTLALVLFAFVMANAQTYVSESFEGSTCPPTGWTIIYGDSDASVNTMTHSATAASAGAQSFRFSSYDRTSDYTQYLITPMITATDSLLLMFDYRRHTSGSETFKVGYSTTTMDVTSFVWGDEISNASTTWQTYSAVLAPNVKYIAIKYYSDYKYYLYVDNFMVSSATGSSLSASADTLSFGQITTTTNKVGSFTINTVNVAEAISLTTTSPFSLSLDGTTFSNSVTIPAPTTVVATIPVYAKFESTSAGVYTEEVSFATSSLTGSLYLTGEAIECQTISTFPYTYDFNTGLYPPLCWTVVDEDNYTRVSYDTIGVDYGLAFLSEDRIVTPEISTSNPLLLSFDYSTYVGRLATTTFSVGYSTTTTDSSSFTWMTPVAANSDDDLTYTTILPNNVKYVAIQADEIGVYVFYTSYLFINNFSLTEISQGMLLVDQDTLDFGAMGVNNTAEKSFVVSGANLTDDIVITAPAQYLVSTNGTTFATSDTVSANGGTIYVRYAPTVAGVHTGTIDMTSGSMSASVYVLGEAVNCTINQYPFTEDFAPTSSTLPCWQVLDANNDGDASEGTGMISFMAYSETNPGCAVYFYSEVNDANDWLISPAMTLETSMYAAFDYLVADATYPEKFSVYVIPDGGTIANAVNVLTTQTATNEDWLRQYVDLSAYANQTVRIAIKIESDADDWYIVFDNFEVASAAESIATDPQSLTFSAAVGTPSNAQMVDVQMMSVTGNVTVTTAAPFEVSADGYAYATTATLAASGLITNATLYVRYNPIAAGTATGAVTLTSTNASATINVTGVSVDCNTPETLPFHEDFEDALTACWQNIDNDGDGYYWMLEEEIAFEDIQAYMGASAMYSASYVNATSSPLTPDNWLITPQLAIPANQVANIQWYVKAQDGNYPEEYYEVLVSTSNTLSSFTTVFSETLQSGDWEARNVQLSNAYSGQNIYIAFRHYNCTDNYMMAIDELNVTASPVGVEEYDATARIYPNPATTAVNIEANAIINTVEVFNVMGQKIASFDANDVRTSINTADFANGVYSVRISTENGVVNQKFTVAR